jgi:hypothetical protein
LGHAQRFEAEIANGDQHCCWSPFYVRFGNSAPRVLWLGGNGPSFLAFHLLFASASRADRVCCVHPVAVRGAKPLGCCRSMLSHKVRAANRLFACFHPRLPRHSLRSAFLRLLWVPFASDPKKPFVGVVSTSSVRSRCARACPDALPQRSLRCLFPHFPCCSALVTGQGPCRALRASKKRFPTPRFRS